MQPFILGGIRSRSSNQAVFSKGPCPPSVIGNGRRILLRSTFNHGSGSSSMIKTFHVTMSPDGPAAWRTATEAGLPNAFRATDHGAERLHEISSAPDSNPRTISGWLLALRMIGSLAAEDFVAVHGQHQVEQQQSAAVQTKQARVRRWRCELCLCASLTNPRQRRIVLTLKCFGSCFYLQLLRTARGIIG